MPFDPFDPDDPISFFIFNEMVLEDDEDEEDDWDIELDDED